MIKTAVAAYITRNTSSWFNPSQDWTKLFRFRYNSAIISFVSGWLYSNDNTYAQPYITVSNSAAGVQDLLVEVFDGVTTFRTSASVLVTLTNYRIAIRYSASTHTLDFIANGVIIGSVFTNLDLFARATNDFALNDGASDSIISLGYERLYQRALTLAQIITEQASIVAVDKTNLLSDCPLQTSLDFTDHNLNARQFSPNGVITTDTSDPLLAVVAAPPSNISPATATAITIASAAFQNTITAGSETKVWYKIDIPAGSPIKALSACAFGNLTAYFPRISVYEGLSNANGGITYILLNDYENVPIQFPVNAGNTYYLECDRNEAAHPHTATAVLILSVISSLDLQVPGGSIAVQDDAPKFPLALIGTNNQVLKYINPFPAGDGADIVNTGEILVEDIVANSVKSYDKNYNLVSEYSLIPRAFPTLIKASIAQDAFYVCRQLFSVAYSEILKFSLTGVLLKSWTLSSGASADIMGMAVSPDDTTLYFMGNSILTAGLNSIRRWDLVNNVPLTDFIPGIAGQLPLGAVAGFDCLLVLPDGSVVVIWHTTGPYQAYIKRYSTSGVILNTYLNIASLAIFRLASSQTVGNFWVMTSLDGIVDNFYEIRASDGAIITTVTNVIYVIGEFDSAETNTPARFGHSNIGAFWVTRLSSVNSHAGLYKMVIDKRNDTLYNSTGVADSKIPDPYADTYMVGDE